MALLFAVLTLLGAAAGEPSGVALPLAPAIAAAQPALVYHAVSTHVPAAQEAFDEGLTLIYAFNREEARKRFERAAVLDPNLAMAQWGVALAVGPNINIPMTAPDLTVASAALARAKKLEPGASPEEQRYIDALAVRYPKSADADTGAPYGAYRDAMKAIHSDYPGDVDAATLYGESIMDVDSWGYDGAGRPVGSEPALLATLHAALAIDPAHVGANHYLVHALDAPGVAEGAVRSARLLAALPAEPAASHLVHMAGHTFLDVGDFVELERANTIAMHDDEAYAASIGKKPWDLDYYGHNLDFYGGSGLMLGDWAVADDAAARFAASKSTRALLIYARERRWSEIAAWPAPDPKRAFDNAFYRYTRGLAAVARHDAAAATSERAALVSLASTSSRFSGFRPLLTMLLDARIAHLKGDDVVALEKLHAFSVATADYAPEVFAPWYFPVGEWSGTIMLRDGDVVGAERAFRDELARTPHDARVLFGLSEALEQQGRAAEARALAPQIVASWHAPASALLDPDI